MFRVPLVEYCHVKWMISSPRTTTRPDLSSRLFQIGRRSQGNRVLAIDQRPYGILSVVYRTQEPIVHLLRATHLQGFPGPPQHSESFGPLGNARRQAKKTCLRLGVCSTDAIGMIACGTGTTIIQWTVPITRVFQE